MTLRTDLNIVQYPVPVPDFGGLLGKGRTQTDPNFGTKIARLTDGSIAMNHSMFPTSWNKDDTLILACGTNGVGYLFQFDPATMQGRLMGRHYPQAAAFSRVEPGVVYWLKKGVVNKDVFTRSMLTGQWTFLSTSVVCDFTKILPAGFIINWSGSFAVCADDSTFTVAFSTGVQNTAVNLCSFRAGYGYRMLDTQAGVTSGDWGAIGKAHLISPIRTFPFYLHAASQTPNRDYVILGPKSQPGWNDTNLYWFLPSLDVIDDNCGGHKAHGMLHAYGNGQGAGKIQEIPYVQPAVNRTVIPNNFLPASVGQVYKQDAHAAFGVLDSNDQTICWMTAGGPSGVQPHVSCWVDEIRGVRVADGVMFRACSTFNSNKSTEYYVQQALGGPSQTGKFFAFCSDMMGTLGATNGGSVGTLGLNARGDVFVVALT